MVNSRKPNSYHSMNQHHHLTINSLTQLTNSTNNSVVQLNNNNTQHNNDILSHSLTTNGHMMPETRALLDQKPTTTTLTIVTSPMTNNIVVRRTGPGSPHDETVMKKGPGRRGRPPKKDAKSRSNLFNPKSIVSTSKSLISNLLN